MSFSQIDHNMMALALRVGATARFTAPPNPAVGCVIARDTELLAQGATGPVGGAHAEVAALHDAEQSGISVKGATAYVTLEPCAHTGHTPPCTEALVAAGIARVVVAIADPDQRVSGKGCEQLRSAGIKVEEGLLEADAEAAHRHYFFRTQNGRPWVRIKLASSLDGRTAMESGESIWISGEQARHDVQLLRAESDCVLSSSGTVLIDNPSLDVRLEAEQLGLDPEQSVRQPLRAIVDSSLRLSPRGRMFKCGGQIRIYSNQIDSNKFNGLEDKVNIISKVSDGDEPRRTGVDLGAMLADLGQLPVNLVHVEAGATLCGALLKAQLVDEIVVYLAPLLMGSQARPQFLLPEISTMTARIPLTLGDSRQVGDDLRLTYHPATHADSQS